MTKIFLKRGKRESIDRRHPWIFSGAIAYSDSEPAEGDIVDVYSHDETFLARGHCAIGSIAIRILTFEQEEIDTAWWEGRIKRALQLRQVLGLTENPETTCYRLVHGEGDNLPGLIIDVYGPTAVIQTHTVGMHLARTEICEALRAAMGGKLKSVYDKSSNAIPPASGVEAADGYIWGEKAEDVVKENGYTFVAGWETGQKTGFFIDQRENRKLLERYSAGRRALNTFSYTGGFSVYALGGGALSVDSVDSSHRAIEAATGNIRQNFPDKPDHREFAVDAFDFIRDMEAGAYDLIVLDPPAFAKSRNSLGNALQGYKRLNAKAIEKIASGGILFTFSCSQAVSVQQFRTAVFSASAIAGRNVRILHQLTQPADHPVNIYHPEGEYLKGLVLYVE